MPTLFPPLSAEAAKNPMAVLRFLDEVDTWDKSEQGGHLQPSVLGHLVLTRLGGAKFPHNRVIGGALHHPSADRIAWGVRKLFATENAQRKLLDDFISVHQDANELYSDYSRRKLTALVNFRKLAPTSTTFPFLTRRQYLFILTAGIHHEDLVKINPLTTVHQSQMSKVHTLLLSNSTTTSLVFGDLSSDWKEKTSDHVKRERPQKPSADAPAKKPWPTFAELKPQGYRRVTSSEEKADRASGKVCPKCGEPGHGPISCPLKNPKCDHHPVCNFLKSHVTSRCKLVKL